MRAALALAVMLATAGGAAADGARNALSVHVLSLGSGGLAVQGERRVARKWSLAATFGARGTRAGDYSSWNAGAGVEGRFWFLGRTRWNGPFVSLELASGYAAVSDDISGDRIGEAMTVTAGSELGWRWLIGRVELTPSLGVGYETQVDLGGRLAAVTRRRASFGLTLGWTF